VAAIAATVGVTSLAIVAVHFRFAFSRDGADVPTSEAVATMLLVLGGAVGMEMYARWAHRALWHDFPAGWALHKSHHEPRVGPFEANDIFAIMNAVRFQRGGRQRWRQTGVP
jgi:beta-carotene 3-hydroxylase